MQPVQAWENGCQTDNDFVLHNLLSSVLQICLLRYRYKFYRIDLAKSLEAGKETTVDVEPSMLTPYSHIQHRSLSQKQFVKFTGNVYFFSPYKTLTHTTTVNCASSSIDSYTKTERPATSRTSRLLTGRTRRRHRLNRYCTLL